MQCINRLILKEIKNGVALQVCMIGDSCSIRKICGSGIYVIVLHSFWRGCVEYCRRSSPSQAIIIVGFLTESPFLPKTKMKKTEHIRICCQQRGIRDPDMDLIVSYGTKTPGRLILTGKDIAAAEREMMRLMNHLSRLKDVCIPMDCETMVTAFREDRRQRRFQARIWSKSIRSAGLHIQADPGCELHHDSEGLL